MGTEKLYYTDAYLREFTATARSCEEVKGGYQVVLDRTAFYPEGGGQPADHGTIGGVPVLDVQERDGEVFHICEKPVEISTPLPCSIDWQRRFDHMQQHSGEHIISGILCGDYRCDNVGFHLGEDIITIDYNRELSWQQVMEAEAKANAVLWRNQPVEISCPSAGELERMDYRSKKELTGLVRIVRFPEADCCACCGTHVRQAGEVGIIKVLSLQKFREGVRLEILCGQRALHYLSRTFEQAKAIGQKLSVKPQDSFAAVERLEAELSEQKYRCGQLESNLFAAIARDYADRGNVMLFQSAMKGDSLRRLADAVAHAAGGLAVVFAGQDGQYAYAMVQAQGEDISGLVKSFNQALQGRGGGRNGFAQGRIQADEAAVRAFFRCLPGDSFAE